MYCTEYAKLVNAMIDEIKYLEQQIVSLRYLASEFMEDDSRSLLRMSILNNTIPEFTDSKEYQDFVLHELDDKDPFEDDQRYRNRIGRFMNGYVTDGYPAIDIRAFDGKLYTINNYLKAKDEL